MSSAAIVANCQTIPFIAPRNIAYIRMTRVRRSYHMSGFLPWLKEDSEIRRETGPSEETEVSARPSKSGGGV